MKEETGRFNSVAQAFHWITALLVLAAFLLGPDDYENHPEGQTDFGIQLHQTLGLCVLTLTVLRVLWIFFDKRPEPVPMARWMTILSKSIMGLLYLLLFAVPVTAIVGTWLIGDPLSLVAGLKVAPFLTLSNDLGENILEAHKLLADSIIWLAGLHAVAALFHHFVLKDGVLALMLPRWLSKDRRR